jgi:hypothetical protein
MKPTTAEIIQFIFDEVERAEAKHPEWPMDKIHAAAIVAEESGELVRATLQHHYEGGKYAEVIKEAVQTAATCIRLIKNS